MKLKFQTWVESGHFSENAKHLLNTSVTCYKGEAYTAALLMSYLGFLVILKDRVMKANKPALFPQPSWDDMIEGLKNEDKWEERIFTAVLQQEKTNSTKVRVQDPVFVINDNLRNQIRFWKDRRNDCAHNKDNAITFSHVEAFWSFLESNLQKITIEGGKATLLNKLERHFDSSYTPANEDLTPLVKEIQSAVEKTEMMDFWDRAISAISDLFDYTHEISFIKKVLQLNDPEITESILQYLKSKEAILMAYINENPSILIHLNYDKQEIRNFWKVKIKKLTNALGVYSSMLLNNLIPKEEIEDVNQLLANLYKYTVNIQDHYVLANNGFGEALYNNLFVVHNKAELKYWQFMNTHYELYTRYIELYPLKNEVVSILCEEMDKTEWHAKFLQQSLDRMFKNNPTKKDEFKQKALGLGLKLPDPIEELHN